VPRQGKGNMRGGAKGVVGSFHNPIEHNVTEHDNPGVKDHVDVERAVEFSKYMDCK
jgi:hypothetical protein